MSEEPEPDPGRPWTMERAIEVALLGGLAVSGTLLAAGLAAGRADLLRFGIVALLLTPLMRVAVVTVAFFHERDRVFGLVSLWVLLLVGSSIGLAAWSLGRNLR